MYTAYVIIPLPNDPALVALQAQLKEAAPDWEWVDPAEFHITLAYSDAVNKTDILLGTLPKAIQAFPVEVRALGTFVNPGSTCLYARVEWSAPLFSLQSQMAALFDAAGAPLSTFSQPDGWQPHITLAYAAPDTVPLAPVWAGDIFLAAEAIELSVEGLDGFVSVYRSEKARRKAVRAPLGGRSRAPLQVWKAADGRYHWSAISSVNAWDRDDEIVTERALHDDVARTRGGLDASNLRFFHIPYQIGPAPEFRTVVDGHLVEMGTFDPTPEAEALARYLIAHPEGVDGSGWGMSIGFFAAPDEDGVFNRIRIYERSILPLSRAANPFTKLLVGES